MNAGTGRPSIWKFIPSVGYLFVFTLLVFAVCTPRFLSYMNMANIVLQGCMLIIVSLGMTMVMLTNGIDLSVGSIMSVSGVVAGLVLSSGSGVAPALLAGILTGGLLGAVNGVMISRVGLPPFIATFGMLGVADGLSLVFSGGETVYWQELSFKMIANGHFLRVPMPVIIGLAAFSIMYHILYRTPFGANIFGMGGNEEALRLAGIPIARHKTFTYGLSGVMAAVSGIVLASRVSSAHPTGGFGYEFEAIAAAVIGGTSFFGGRGGITGTIIGALIITMIRNGLSLLGYTTPVQFCFMGILLAVGVILNKLIYR